MAQWRVTQGEHQFTVADLTELVERAKRGELVAGDLIQPPESNAWVYAMEIEALRPHLPEDREEDDDELLYRPRRPILPVLIVASSLFVILAGGAIAAVLLQQLPTGEERLVGERGLSYTEVIVTDADASLLAEPKEGAPSMLPVAKDSTLQLLAKRGDFYKVRTAANEEGWIPIGEVLPAYKFGGAEVKERYDPLYNPDRYVKVLNASWIQMPLAPHEKPPEEGVPTTFHFMFGNDSAYDMTDLVVRITIKDAAKAELGHLDIPIRGTIPRKGQTMVGTLQPSKGDPSPPVYMTTHSFQEQARTDPALQERWADGLTVPMKGDRFDNASVDILEIRAVPDP